MSKNETQDREQILRLVEAYWRDHHKKDAAYVPGDRISYGGRVYDAAEMRNLVDSALDFWLTAGRYADAFEQGLASYLGVPFCSLVNSGSSANLLAFMTLTSPLLGERAIRRGDEVITVAAAFPTTVAPIIQFGAIPVFVDVTIPQYNIDVSLLEGARSDRTRAVMLAHTLGNPFDIAAVKAFCDKYGLWLIEDNCDALGSLYTLHGVERPTGTIGHIGTSSFYPPHHMTMGEGGAVYTSDPLLHKIIRSLRDWGRECSCAGGQDNRCGNRFNGQFGELPFGYDHKYVYSHFGYNFQATDMQASIGCAQLEKLPDFTQRRRRNFDLLKELLADQQDKLILPEPAPDSTPSWFGFVMTCRQGVDRSALVRAVEAAGVQTRTLFAGNLLRHPCAIDIREQNAYRVASPLTATDRVMNDTFWIGVYPGMDDARIQRMASVIKEALR